MRFCLQKFVSQWFVVQSNDSKFSMHIGSNANEIPTTQNLSYMNTLKYNSLAVSFEGFILSSKTLALFSAHVNLAYFLGDPWVSLLRVM